MPFSTCPSCGQTFHLCVTKDLEAWYKKFAPDKNIGEEVKLHCFECWKSTGQLTAIDEGID